MKILLVAVFLALPLSAQTPTAFEKNCAKCHGADGNGGDTGPSIIYRIRRRDDEQFATLIREGLPGRMPGTPVNDDELASIIGYLRSIRGMPPATQRKVSMADGSTLQGEVRSEGRNELQMRTSDNRIHLLRRTSKGYREVTSSKDWPTYDGVPGGNRYTTLTGIDKTNVARLTPQWMFTVRNASQLQGTPVVSGGLMYVSFNNECWALDAGSGREVWHYAYPLPRGLFPDAKTSTNRGVGIAGDLVFMETSHAHIIALDRLTGLLLWDSEIADWHANYFATSAPLPLANGLVATGVAGGESGANGMVVAFDQATGKEAWRFNTVPKRGEPGAETWGGGKDIDHGGAPTWFNGTYDPELDIVYWPTGNPSKEYNGSDRPGDNLYTDSILALNGKTGALKWYFQFTPHDLWDWDSTETSVLIDADWEGAPRKLMLHADRNGFFYVFDRTNGKLLLWKPFVRNLTWASGLDANGRPIKLPNQDPAAAGTRVCPSQDGATNWFSPSFNPQTGLYYLQTFEKCSIYTKQDEEWQPGKSYLGGTQRVALDGKAPERVLKAIDIKTGKIVWEVPEPGAGGSWGGTLATSTGLVFFADETGAFVAVDAVRGRQLWSFAANANWRASPMTYEFDGKQYIAIAANGSIISFSIPGSAPQTQSTPRTAPK